MFRAADASPPNPGSAHESARFIASISLSLGALMLSLFGIIERMVTFEKLGIVNEFALLALLPGIATLAFLACARAISWMISNLRFEQWHAVVPEPRCRGEGLRARGGRFHPSLSKIWPGEFATACERHVGPVVSESKVFMRGRRI